MNERQAQSKNVGGGLDSPRSTNKLYCFRNYPLLYPRKFFWFKSSLWKFQFSFLIFPTLTFVTALPFRISKHPPEGGGWVYILYLYIYVILVKMGKIQLLCNGCFCLDQALQQPSSKLLLASFSNRGQEQNHPNRYKFFLHVKENSF